MPNGQNKSGFVEVHIDDHVVADPSVMFQYKPNPEFISVHPQSVIPSYVVKYRRVNCKCDSIMTSLRGHSFDCQFSKLIR